MCVVQRKYLFLKNDYKKDKKKYIRKGNITEAG